VSQFSLSQAGNNQWKHFIAVSDRATAAVRKATIEAVSQRTAIVWFG
jgi:hypothetical protein